MSSVRPGMWSGEIRSFAAEMGAAGRSPETIRLRSYWLRRLQLEVGDAEPWEVTRDQLVEWLSYGGWQPETRKVARSTVSTFYRWAVDTGRITAEDNPAGSLPTVTVPRPDPRPTPERTFAAALRGANDRDRLMLKLGGLQGMRRAEIARFHPLRDVDRDRGMLRVHGKGGRIRWIPLSPDVLREVDAELVRRDGGGCGTGYRYQSYVTAGGYMFPGHAGGTGHVGPDVPGRVLARLLGDQWTAHTLRHRFATAAYAAERDLRAVQELLGHSRPETTAIYVQVPQDATRTAVLAAGRITPDAAA